MIGISEQCKSANQIPGTMGFGTQDQILGGLFFTYDSLLFCRKAQTSVSCLDINCKIVAFVKRVTFYKV